MTTWHFESCNRHYLFENDDGFWCGGAGGTFDEAKEAFEMDMNFPRQDVQESREVVKVFIDSMYSIQMIKYEDIPNDLVWKLGLKPRASEKNAAESTQSTHKHNCICPLENFQLWIGCKCGGI